jgi:hypothetical protein
MPADNFARAAPNVWSATCAQFERIENIFKHSNKNQNINNN